MLLVKKAFKELVHFETFNNLKTEYLPHAPMM